MVSLPEKRALAIEFVIPLIATDCDRLRPFAITTDFNRLSHNDE
jgi:hypothetical protein